MKPFVRDNLRISLEGKKILLGVSGSIAAFKACDIVRWLRDAGAEVRVVLTDSAQKFVTPTTLENLSGNPVLSTLWDAHGTHHIDAARWADLVLVAPATANVLGKLAQGLADDLLSTELLAFQGPVLIAPAMNPAMYAHPAVQKNVETLRGFGHRLLGPTVGETACGEEGLGRMIEPEEIVQSVAQAFWRKPRGARAVITLGPTRSPLDPVRYLTNRSSGRMGAALCWAAARAGFDVTAVCGPMNTMDAELPPGIRVERVTTAREMARAALEAWKPAQLYIGAAAVLDWDVANPSAEKLKKGAGAPMLEFTQNPDILAMVSAERREDQFVLGFAAETADALAQGYQKLLAKGCNAIFANDVSQPDSGFESEWNRGTWIEGNQAGERLAFDRMTKIELADKLLAQIEKSSIGPARALHAKTH